MGEQLHDDDQHYGDGEYAKHAKPHDSERSYKILYHNVSSPYHFYPVFIKQCRIDGIAVAGVLIEKRLLQLQI